MTKIKNFFKEFNEFLLVRRMNKSLELSAKDKIILKSYDKEFEKKMNQVMLDRLSQEMVSWNITPEIQRWAQLAMTWRISILGNLSTKE